MALRRRTFMLGLLLGAPLLAVRAQIGAGSARRRDQTGGVNDAQPPAIFTVVSVDSYGQTLKLRAADGSVSNVYVDSSIFDITKLKAGDRVRVDFVVPDAMNPRLSAASLWPLK